MHARLRMLMNSQPNDGSPGGAPSGTVAPAAPPAQGGGGGEDPFEKMSKLIDTKLTEHRNGIFADLRKAGALGKEKPREEAKPTGEQPLTAADVERMTQRANQLGRATAGLSDEQTSLMERLYRAENPEDVIAWAKTTRAALGIAGGAVQSANQPTTAQRPPNAIPVSDAGAPAAPATFTEDTPLWQLKPQDRDHLRRTKGDAWYNATLRAQLKGTRVVLKKP